MKKIMWCVVGLMMIGWAAGCGSPKPQFVLRVNCAATEAYTDAAGSMWLADQSMTGDNTWGATDGEIVDRGELGMETTAPRVYETERYSMSGYTFTLAPGSYTVRLHFAETYDGITGAGERVFDVTINGETVLKDFDVYKEAGGSEKPVVKVLRGMQPTEGKITIGFVANIQNPEINGIEILSE